MASAKEPPVERVWQQLAQFVGGGYRGEIRQRHVDIAGEFPQDLAACTAWGCGFGRVGNHRNASKSAVAIGQCLEHRDPFGAQRQPVGRIFDVAAGDDMPIGRLERGADFEA